MRDFRADAKFAWGAIFASAAMAAVFSVYSPQSLGIKGNLVGEIAFFIVGSFSGYFVSHHFHLEAEKQRISDQEYAQAQRQEDQVKEEQERRNQNEVIINALTIEISRVSTSSQSNKFDSISSLVSRNYSLLYDALGTLIKVIDRNRASIYMIELQEFSKHERSRTIEMCEYTDDEWREIRSIKNYFKMLATTVIGSGLNEHQIRAIVNRGAADYFYELWAITIHKFFLVRAPVTHAGQLSAAAFDTEKSIFEMLEPFLDETRKAKKSLWAPIDHQA